MTWMSPLGQIYTTQAFTYHQRTQDRAVMSASPITTRGIHR